MNAITEFFETHETIKSISELLISIVIAGIVVFVLLRLQKKLSHKLKTEKKGLNFRFVENIIRFVIIFIALQWVIMSNDLTKSFGATLFQGTTVIAAIAGFAAQPVLSDLICGLMISMTKPFDIGDRVELENGTTGIVKDMTLRHVTIQTIDTIRVTIPNHQLNSMQLTNLSYHSTIRSVHFRFNVAYSADPEKAAKVIREAVASSPFSVRGRDTNHGKDYSPVYFLSYAESSLVMATTVYYEPTNPTELVKNDINIRVKKALSRNNIEIPYNYLNVVLNKQSAADSETP